MRWVALVSLTVAMGCGTSPSAQFFTLDALRPAGPPPTTAGAPLKVVAVHVPSVLDRQEIVEEGAAGTLSVSDEHRWGAPFGDMVRRVLTQDLAARLPKDMVLFPDQPAPPGANDLVVDILEFERDASGAVVFDGSWSLVQGSSDSTLLAHQVHLRDGGVAPGYKASVAAMSRLLGALADQIVAGISAARDSTIHRR